MTLDIAHFEALHQHPDPWGYHTRWYEARKRDLVLAALTRPRYRRGLELGCSNGALTRVLATRCDSVVATDAAANAVAQARSDLADLPHVEVLHQLQPRDWPEGRFDLIVLGEIGYYLDFDELHSLTARIRDSLLDDALVVGAHWRHPAPDRRLDTRVVHEVLDTMGLRGAFMYLDTDLLVQGWTNDVLSVAQREGLA